ncbi:MAG: hypothetical protein WBA84_07675 [Carnobacterium sp.]|uniref:hypothetical protein n=1 Tax=Carnobacterium sp. TaxID=48221 RepID=UPI003C721BFB
MEKRIEKLDVLEIGAIQDLPQDVQETLLTGKEWRNKNKQDINDTAVLKTDTSNKVDYSVFYNTVHQLQREIASLKGFISQLQDAMILKADKDDLISQINVCEDGVKIEGKNFLLDGDVIKFKQLSGRKFIYSEDGTGTILIKPETVSDEESTVNEDNIVSGTLNSNKMDIINIKEEK